MVASTCNVTLESEHPQGNMCVGLSTHVETTERSNKLSRAHMHAHIECFLDCSGHLKL